MIRIKPKEDDDTTFVAWDPDGPIEKGASSRSLPGRFFCSLQEAMESNGTSEQATNGPQRPARQSPESTLWSDTATFFSCNSLPMNLFTSDDGTGGLCGRDDPPPVHSRYNTVYAGHRAHSQDLYYHGTDTMMMGDIIADDHTEISDITMERHAPIAIDMNCPDQYHRRVSNQTWREMKNSYFIRSSVPHKSGVSSHRFPQRHKHRKRRNVENKPIFEFPDSMALLAKYNRVASAKAPTGKKATAVADASQRNEEEVIEFHKVDAPIQADDNIVSEDAETLNNRNSSRNIDDIDHTNNAVSGINTDHNNAVSAINTSNSANSATRLGHEKDTPIYSTPTKSSPIAKQYSKSLDADESSMASLEFMFRWMTGTDQKHNLKRTPPTQTPSTQSSTSLADDLEDDDQGDYREGLGLIDFGEDRTLVTEMEEYLNCTSDDMPRTTEGNMEKECYCAAVPDTLMDDEEMITYEFAENPQATSQNTAAEDKTDSEDQCHMFPTCFETAALNVSNEDLQADTNQDKVEASRTDDAPECMHFTGDHAPTHARRSMMEACTFPTIPENLEEDEDGGDAKKEKDHIHDPAHVPPPVSSSLCNAEHMTLCALSPLHACSGHLVSPPNASTTATTVEVTATTATKSSPGEDQARTKSCDKSDKSSPQRSGIDSARDSLRAMSLMDTSCQDSINPDEPKKVKGQAVKQFLRRVSSLSSAHRSPSLKSVKSDVSEVSCKSAPDRSSTLPRKWFQGKKDAKRVNNDTPRIPEPKRQRFSEPNLDNDRTKLLDWGGDSQPGRTVPRSKRIFAGLFRRRSKRHHE